MDTLALGPFEIKAFSFEKREIEGVASTSHRDLGGDVVKIPGAFTKTLTERGPGGVELRVNHDYSALPIGSMLALEERSSGLHMKARVYDTVAGSDLLATIRQMRAEGKSVGLSIGYSIKPGGARFDVLDGKRVRVLEDLDLREISVTTTPMNTNTNITSVKTAGGAMYGVRKSGDAWVVTKDGEPIGDPFASEDAAKAAVDKLAADDGGKTVAPNTLSDDCFLWIQPGGVKDDESKTVPRTLRHFRFRDASGAIDPAALTAALSEIPQAKGIGLDDADLARLATRVRRMVEQHKTGLSLGDEPAEWQAGATLDLLTVAYRLQDVAERIAGEQQHRKALGEGVKNGWRMGTDLQVEVKAVADELARIAGHVALVAEGKDEEALADWWRAQFDLMGVAR